MGLILSIEIQECLLPQSCQLGCKFKSSYMHYFYNSGFNLEYKVHWPIEHKILLLTVIFWEHKAIIQKTKGYKFTKQ